MPRCGPFDWCSCKRAALAAYAPIQLRLSSLTVAKAPHPSPTRGKGGGLFGRWKDYTFTHFPFLADDFTAASMKAMPRTPSSTVGNITAGSSFFFERAARTAAATSV